MLIEITDEKLTNEQADAATKKGQLIGAIITKLRFMAEQGKKEFDYTRTFFDLVNKNNEELLYIAKLAGI